MSGQAESAKPKPGLLDRLRGSAAKKPALNKPAYYADGGALMGTVVDVENDDQGEPSGFVVETDYGERMRFPNEQFEITERGLIYRPLWKESLHGQIKELEERIRAAETGDSMVVAQLMQLKTFDAQAIKKLKVSHPGQEVVFESFAGMVALYRELRQRLEVLEVERIRARSDLTMHAGDRLLKHSSRRDFAKLVLAERRRYEICDINIKHVRKLLKRLHDSPYFPSHLFPMPAEDEDEEGGVPLPFEDVKPPDVGSPSLPELTSEPVVPQPELTPEEPETPPALNKNNTTKKDPAKPAGQPRVTFTPAPSALRRPLSLQEEESAPTNDPEVLEQDRQEMAPRSANRREPTSPRQTLQNWQRQNQAKNKVGRTLPTRGNMGLAGSFQSMVSTGHRPSAPLNVTSPGVANSLLSFVNEARTTGKGKGKPKGRGGPAMVLNLGR